MEASTHSDQIEYNLRRMGFTQAEMDAIKEARNADSRATSSIHKLHRGSMLDGLQRGILDEYPTPDSWCELCKAATGLDDAYQKLLAVNGSSSVRISPDIWPSLRDSTSETLAALERAHKELREMREEATLNKARCAVVPMRASLGAGVVAHFGAHFVATAYAAQAAAFLPAAAAGAGIGFIYTMSTESKPQTPPCVSDEVDEVLKRADEVTKTVSWMVRRQIHANSSEVEPLGGFVCPITGEVMVDPVICADGHSYERAAIQTWLAEHGTSPMTGAPLNHTMLLPNHALRNAAQEDAGLL